MLIQVLKRKDAASIIVAILIALAVSPALGSITSPLSARMSGLAPGEYIAYSVPGAGFGSQYVFPLVWAASQIVAIELVIRLYIFVMKQPWGKK
jgi:hypothetical protein